MSDDQITGLESAVNKAKVKLEEAEKTLDGFDRKLHGLFLAGEMTVREHGKINYRISAPSHGVLYESNLPSQLDNILRLSHVRTAAPLFGVHETLRRGEWIDLFVVLKDLGFPLNTLFEKPLPSVDIVGIRRREQPISKAVDNLLYTYTPFKLRGARSEDYTILLLPSIRGGSISRSWFSNEVDYFFENGVKIITPDEVRPTRVSEIRDLIRINGEQYFRLEIDNRIADGAHYCRMGQYISPLRNCNNTDCWLWDSCNGTRFWSKRPRLFYSIAKISPNICVRVDSYETPRTLGGFEDIMTFEQIDQLLAKIYIESVNFMSRYMVRNPLIRLRETVGYRVNTRSIAVAIDATWLKSFVRELLLRDGTLYTWMYAKHFVMDNFNVNDIRQVSGFFWNLITSVRNDKTNRFARGLQEKDVTDDLVEFACMVLLHTLSHALHEEIVAVLQTSSDNIVYAYSHSPERDGKFRIFLFENAERGLGLTQSFSSRVQNGKEKVIAGIIQKMAERAGSCGIEIASAVSMENASDNVRTIVDRLNFYNRTLNTTYGISVPVEIARYILAREDDITARLIDREDVSAFMDDILSTMPLCWDGCYQCVRLETDCHEPPYEQLFTVGKGLLMSLLGSWQESINEKVQPPMETGAKNIQAVVSIGKAKNLFGYVEQAKKSVRITSPWISEKVAEQINDIALKKGISFEILTSLDENVETHKKTLRFLRESAAPQVRARALKERALHAKMVIVDDELLIIGSANLTLSGLYENVESYAVLASPDVLRESVSKFKELWNSAASLNE